MATYLKKWRKLNSTVRAAVYSTESEDPATGNEEIRQETENQGQLINNESNSLTLSIHDKQKSDSQSENALLSDDFDNDVEPNSSSETSQMSNSSENYDFVFESSDTDVPSDNGEEIKSKLAAWAVKHKITRDCLNDLMFILSNEGYELPKDARTLLRTQVKFDISQICGGEFIYFGIEQGVQNIILHTQFVLESEIKLLFNIDGLPLFKSSSTQLWPILCSFGECTPFVVALYCGDNKPNDLEVFLDRFVTELNSLTTNGVEIQGNRVIISIKAFVCDSPARAFVKNIKGHTAYFACERCDVKGEYVENRIIYSGSQKGSLRNDEGFDRLEYKPSHQNGASPLSNTDILMVSHFSLDYMHLVCLGVVKRILHFLIKGPKRCRLSHAQKTRISEKMVSFRENVPSEFARKPRSLQYIERWKATEFRQFILYTGMVALEGIVSKQVYVNFLSLSIAISIMLETDSEKRTAQMQLARRMTNNFISSSKDAYSDIFNVYNVHCLSHLAEDVEFFGCSLNNVSAFPFENFLQKIKGFVKKGQSPLTQIARRVKEIEMWGFESSNQSKHVFKCSTHKRDSGFFDRNGNLVMLRKEVPDGFEAEIINKRSLTSFFTQPCDSKTIDIYLCNTNKSSYGFVRRINLTRKVVCLSHRKGTVIIPLRHN